MDIDSESLARFFHVLFGIVWIGHLYFFNLTNLPAFKMSIKGNDAGQKGGPHLMMRALWWFRWGAMGTLLFGLWLLDERIKTLGMDYSGFFELPEGQNIGIGMALAIVMWFNVWFIIWPAQKVVLGNNMAIAKGVAEDEKKRLEGQNAPLAARAKMASRFNFWASIPMLFFMVFASHVPLELW
ncbi:MAG TPA: hypothetical protein VI796_05685 [Candidatus Thermoplasmatota archaeon]|nr:hypothetical protein [Candidatus Thermoplasmatota archaeon]